MAAHGLNDAQLERLAVLSEELGEIIQVIGKITRHGYESRYPIDDEEAVRNRVALMVEIGDLLAVLSIMDHCGDIHGDVVAKCTNAKLQRIKKWLHEPDNKIAVDLINDRTNNYDA